MGEIWAGVRELKAHLSEYLRQVSRGQTVIITDLGRPASRLSSVDQSLDERLTALQNAGLVAWNGQKLRPVTPVAANRGDKQVSDILVEMRECSSTWMPARW